MDKQIETTEIFRPASLPMGEDFRSGEVFKVFVISYNVNWRGGVLKTMSPYMECIENSQKFFVVSVIIQFSACKSAGVESHRVNITRIGLNR